MDRLRAALRTLRLHAVRAVRHAGPALRRAADSVPLGARLLAATGLVLMGLLVSVWLLTPACAGGACPSLGSLPGYRPPEPPHVYDRNGELAGHLPGPRRIVVELQDVPRELREGFVAVEDRRFREHYGVDLRAAGRALVRNVTRGRVVEGASTITMQLARNIYGKDLLSSSKWRRKAMEVRLALAIEARLTKDQILELYLNHIYLGGGVYGVGTAALHYFDKRVQELNLAESALLIGLAKNPGGYAPRSHPRRAVNRRDVVLGVLVREGVVAPDRAQRAGEGPLELARRELAWEAGSYYASAVRRELERIITEPGDRAGLRVFTALDPELQRRAEEALVHQIGRVEDHAYGRFTPPETAAGESPGSTSSKLQGMVVSLDPATGRVRALVGGRDFSSTQFDRALQARRQPGSAFKPVVYSAALSEGFTHGHLVRVDSLTVEPQGEYDPAWHLASSPLSETGEAHHTTVRDALVASSNVATVSLGTRLGIGRVIEQARKLGIETEIPSYPSIFLGTAEVVPAELVAAFAAFGNGGRRIEPHLITRIEDPRGRVLWRAMELPVPVLDPRVAYLTLDALRDVVDRGTGWRVRAEGYPGPAAGKTGTTNEGKDVWFVGATPELVTGVWLGFDRPRPIVADASGGRLAAPVWARIMKEWSGRDGGESAEAWPAPSGIVQARIDASSGFLATDDCPGERVRDELFLEGSAPKDHCPLHGRNFLERIVADVRATFGRETSRLRELPP